MQTVRRWTGIEARALRHALRLSVRGFSAHLGVAIRTVSKWEARGASITLQPDSQELLDVALRRSSDEVKSRFGQLVADGRATQDPGEPRTDPATSVFLPVVVDGRAALVPVDPVTMSGLPIIDPGDAALPSELAAAPLATVAEWASGPASSGSDVDLERRRALGALTYGAATIAFSGSRWLNPDVDGGEQNRPSIRVGRGEVEAARDMVALFSRMDQRRGGGHARAAVVQYFTSDVAGYLTGTFRDADVRRDMFSTASELAYLSGWMAFDNGEHAAAQRDFRLAVTLADEAGDAPMTGHVLRAMAHQAVDLGQPSRARDLAEASVDGDRYTRAAPRERALLGVVRARALAAAGQDAEAATALNRAEDDLAVVRPGDDEPGRVFFFGEASLAHETACTLRDIGDLAGAEHQFARSVRTREASTFTRTHAVTLGYLGSVQLRQGNLDGACGTWSKALNAMDGVRSGRTRQVVLDMRTALAPLRRRNVRAAVELDASATEYLDAVTAAMP